MKFRKIIVSVPVENCEACGFSKISIADYGDPWVECTLFDEKLVGNSPCDQCIADEIPADPEGDEPD